MKTTSYHVFDFRSEATREEFIKENEEALSLFKLKRYYRKGFYYLKLIF